MKNYKFLQKSFNLIQSGWSNKTFTEKLYDWAIHVGRYFVIATELVVLIAFGVRFFLDQNLNDLTEKVNDQNQKYKISLQATEKQVNELSSMVSIINKLKPSQIPSGTILDVITNSSSENINIDSIDLKSGIVTLTGTADSPENVTTFRTNLQKTYADVVTTELLANNGRDANTTKRTKFTLNFKYAADKQAQTDN